MVLRFGNSEQFEKVTARLVETNQQLTALNEKYQSLKRLYAALIDRERALEKQLATRQAADLFLGSVTRENPGQEQLLFQIANIEDNDERYRAIVKLLQEQAQNEIDLALEVNIGNDLVNLRRGRAGGLLDAITMLEQGRQRLRAELAERKAA